jgi:hypothetical protein
MSINDFLYPIVNFVIIVAVPTLGAYLWKTLPVVIDDMKTNKELNKHIIIKEAALDAWHGIEEDSRLGDLVTSKFQAFEKKMQTKIPGITDEEILDINKALAGKFNEGKAAVEKAVEPEGILIPAPVVAPVEQPVVIAVPRYFKPDVTPLPVEATPVETPAPVVNAMPIILAPTQKYVNENGDELVLKSTI